jgi:arylformamidase
MQQIYDVTRTVSPTIAVWPGDTPMAHEWTMLKTDGASVNLARLDISCHTGTHMDATYHYDDDGIHPAQMPLESYIGTAHVVTVLRETGPITPPDLPANLPDNIERILIHSRYSELPDDVFDASFPYPTVELIDWLAERNCRLFGVDMPSVDKFDSTELPVHHRLKHHGIVNLETLNLSGVPDGKYELIALPLKLDKVCGGPIRAILRELD